MRIGCDFHCDNKANNIFNDLNQSDIPSSLFSVCRLEKKEGQKQLETIFVL